MGEQFLPFLSFVAFLIFAFDPSSATLGSHGTTTTTTSNLKTYIIQVRAPENVSFATQNQLENWYRSFLPPTVANSRAPRYVYSYTDAITGFAARLTDEELSYVEKKDGFLARHEDRILPLLTTHTPSFLGLPSTGGLWNKSSMGKGVIIGLLDSGITPRHPSFSDENMEEPPPKWKGLCNFKGTSRCNKKLIGAKVFMSQVGTTATNVTTDDDEGHGTHTASTAAGNFVDHANVLGSAPGTASGVAPHAHIAMYKVCGPDGCSGTDILAGMDAAIKDGVDVLSLSLGGPSVPFYDDYIAIGAFNAVRKGIFVSCAAGNSGPISQSLSNEAPWLLTVGAASMDRNIRATVKLGNGQEFDGESAFQPTNFSPAMHPLVFPSGGAFGDCVPSTLGSEVKGKIVVCPNGVGIGIEIGGYVKEAGGVAVILVNAEGEGFTVPAEAHVLPASNLNYVDGQKVADYMIKNKDATATIIFKGTILGISPAPVMTFFSSRGPSFASPGVLKPDISGPGLNVLAAWPFQVGPPRKNMSETTFDMISGTSMATPHLSGVAALLKLAHPDWSPAAIKSAIMTTSDVADRDGRPIMDEQHQRASYFALGSGHVNPTKAVDPGLVYDLSTEDYVAYLCALNYTDAQMETLTRKKNSCRGMHTSIEDLNYPAIALDVGVESATVTRTVTNVGPANSEYRVKVENVVGEFTAIVTPETLEFSAINEKKSYTVTMTCKNSTKHGEGNLWWISDEHSVRIPIMLY